MLQLKGEVGELRIDDVSGLASERIIRKLVEASMDAVARKRKPSGSAAARGILDES
jgi:hypothetical protein